ncbi:hypothetical protein [Nocardia sp. CNY236]|uniref:hypothetical protein n=1 Tax=Nocardia sp. CNY236 TaxID=1169152 RepID=UPI0003FDFDB9|nr:hypothetical protein [Nocardia sp. CNY236]
MRSTMMLCALVAGIAFVGGCSGGQSEPADSSTLPTTPAVAAVTPANSETPAQRNVRVRQTLIELGCSSNACIQTYFGCADGYITGDACQFYREHPID